MSSEAREIERLQAERVVAEEQVFVATMALKMAEYEYDTLEAQLTSQKHDTENLKHLTSDALTDVKAKCSKASRAKQSAVDEASAQRKNLLGFASSHSNMISVTGGEHHILKASTLVPELGGTLG